jgi:hypothetical protein
MAICTYHKEEDEKELNEHLIKYGFETSHSDGYMLLYKNKNIRVPYLRRSLIRAIKR